MPPPRRHISGTRSMNTSTVLRKCCSWSPASLCTSALVLVCLLLSVGAAPIRIALSRKTAATPRVNSVALHHQQNASEPALRQLTSVNVGKRLPLKNYGNVQYIGKVAFGNPLQPMDVVFDTGSSDTWIPSIDCASCGSHNRFEYPLSTTFLDTQAKFFDAVRCCSSSHTYNIKLLNPN